ncbi:MAG: hypothetical protein QM764_11110 [Chitinophagaceae bacterium]
MYQGIRTAGVLLFLSLLFLALSNTARAIYKPSCSDYLITYNLEDSTLRQLLLANSSVPFSVWQGGLVHPEKKSNGITRFVIEKNIVVLLQKTNEQFSDRKNNRIRNRNNSRVSTVKTELNSFYNTQRNELSDQMEVYFYFNVIGLEASNLCQNSIDSINHIGVNYGLLSSDTIYKKEIYMLTPAAVITIPGPRGVHAQTNGIAVRTEFWAKGVIAHEIGHTFGLLDDNDSRGLMSDSPSIISSTEVEKILLLCRKK